jgi:hypothetical protein
MKVANDLAEQRTDVGMHYFFAVSELITVAQDKQR